MDNGFAGLGKRVPFSPSGRGGAPATRIEKH